MRSEDQFFGEAAHKGFEVDNSRRVIFDHGRVILLAPHEANILQLLVTNRGRLTPMDTLTSHVCGNREMDTAAISVRVAIHSLRKKIKSTGLAIRAEPSVGYELDASRVLELNQRLTDKMLMELNAVLR